MLSLSAVDLGLISGDRALVLRHQELLICDLLEGNRVLLGEGLVTCQIGLRLRQQALVLLQLALCLFERRLIRPVIDLGQEIAGFHHLAFLEADLLKVAADLRLHGDRGKRGDGAESIQGDRNIAGRRGGGADGLRRQAVAGRTAGGAGFFGAQPKRHGSGGDEQQKQESEQPAPPRRARILRIFLGWTGRSRRRSIYGFIHLSLRHHPTAHAGSEIRSVSGKCQRRSAGIAATAEEMSRHCRSTRYWR